MLDTPCSEVVWRVLAIYSIRQFPLHFPSCASPCAITFQMESTTVWPCYWWHNIQILLGCENVNDFRVPAWPVSSTWQDECHGEKGNTDAMCSFVSGTLVVSALWWGQIHSALPTGWDTTELVCFICSGNCLVFLHINTLNTELIPICHLLALLGAHHILHVSRLRVNTDMESSICNDRDLEVFWIRDVTRIWSTVPKIYEGESKSKVNLPVGALQSTHWETDLLSKYSHDYLLWRWWHHFQIALLWNSELWSIFWGSKGVKTPEAGDMHQAQKSAVWAGGGRYFAPR